MKKIILLAGAFVLINYSFGQKIYFTKSGTVSFKAGTALEDIDALNKSATCVFDASTGSIQFMILIKGFEFKRALMMEHFNENYMESSKFPKAVFTGKIINPDKINFQKDGTYPATVKGVLELHGVKKEIEAAGTFKVSGENVLVNADFAIAMADYNIEIPGVVKNKIAPTAKISVNCNNTIKK